MTIIGVPAKDSPAAMREFVERHGLEDMPQAVDEDTTQVWARYDVAYQPAWVFVDEDGDVRVHAGGLYGDGITAAIDELLAR